VIAAPSPNEPSMMKKSKQSSDRQPPAPPAQPIVSRNSRPPTSLNTSLTIMLKAMKPVAVASSVASR